MAIFEKSPQSRVTLDDTERLTCTITNAQNINGHTEYILNVQRGTDKESCWKVSRRYNDFASLRNALMGSKIELPLPPKKLIGYMEPSFIAERQISLQKFIDEVLKHQILALSLPVRHFLDPNNYSLNLHETALQSVSIALRGDGHYEIKGALPDIGWRIRKKYFLVTNEHRTKTFMLCWQTRGPDFCLTDRDCSLALKALQNISHPHIDQILLVHSLEAGAFVVRNVHSGGSLRDMLRGADYTKPHMAKYTGAKVKPFTEGQIAHYGLQILQALEFLREKGVPYGHLHAGNVAIENQKALLMDIENGLLGAPSLYRPYILQHKKVNSLEAVDVYCFGQTIYEMAFGYPLNASTCDDIPQGMSPYLVSALTLCLSTYSLKKGLPSLQYLMGHPLFSRADWIPPALDSRAHLKLPSQIKDGVKSTIDKIEARLKGDQKSVRNARREVRIQEILGSEEELRKQRRRAKKHDAAWKSTSSLAETVQSQASTSSSPSQHRPAESSRMSTSTSATSVAAASSASAASPSATSAPTSRTALLSAICSFDKNSLNRTAT